MTTAKRTALPGTFYVTGTQTPREMYRDHMTECLIRTGADPEQARQEAQQAYPEPSSGESNGSTAESDDELPGVAYEEGGQPATKHTCNDGNGPAFGRKIAGCPRCDELIAGAAPVQWAGSQRRQDDARRAAEIRAHDCRASRCAAVCTFGDW